MSSNNEIGKIYHYKNNKDILEELNEKQQINKLKEF